MNQTDYDFHLWLSAFFVAAAFASALCQFILGVIIFIIAFAVASKPLFEEG